MAPKDSSTQGNNTTGSHMTTPWSLELRFDSVGQQLKEKMTEREHDILEAFAEPLVSRCSDNTLILSLSPIVKVGTLLLDVLSSLSCDEIDIVRMSYGVSVIEETNLGVLGYHILSKRL
ncbi:hypothetical protein EDD21DRAFT_421960 [Dissophora ornata]|nr:hypothetical protein EDD21DRAFT_421960 [Dissophora ornata]